MTHAMLSCDLLRSIEASLTTESPAITLSDSFRIDIKKFSCTMYITNVTNWPIQVTAYQCFSRVDMSSLAGSPTVGYYNPYKGWETDMKTGSAANGTSTFLNIGVTPFEARNLTNWYKIRKVRKFILKSSSDGNPGFKRIKYVRRNVSISRTRYSDADSVGLKGITCSWLFVVHGLPGSDQTLLSTKCPFGPAKICLNAIHRTIIRNTQDTLTDIKRSDASGLPSTEAPYTAQVATVTNQAILHA